MRFKPRLASRLMIAITIVSAVVAPAHYGPPPPLCNHFFTTSRTETESILKLATPRRCLDTHQNMYSYNSKNVLS